MAAAGPWVCLRIPDPGRLRWPCQGWATLSRLLEPRALALGGMGPLWELQGTGVASRPCGLGQLAQGRLPGASHPTQNTGLGLRFPVQHCPARPDNPPAHLPLTPATFFLRAL